MKKDSLKWIMSLTIISFFSISKWWFVKIDGPDNFMYGFPLAYKSDALHTSLAYEYYILEFFIDFILYFFFWTAIVCLFKKRYASILLPKIISTTLLIISFFIFAFEVFFAFSFDNVVSFKNDYYYESIDSGIYTPFFKKSEIRDSYN